jgi:hypothetical protein
VNPSRALLFLPIVLALALVVRWAPTRELRLAPDERDLGASHWLLDDPETCSHLRRIELGIAGDRVPETDRFVNHPFGGEVPALPFFDMLVAGISQRFQRSPSGEAALAYVDEASLEDLCVQLSPILGLLATLCVFWAASNLASGPRKTQAAVLAALVFALHPAAIACSSAGILDAAVLAASITAVLVRCAVRSLRSETMPTSLLDALIAGGLSGLLMSVTAAGGFVYAAVWLGFFANVLRQREEQRKNALRAGLFFAAVAAFVARMPLAEGPWEAASGSTMQGFSSGVSMLVLYSLAPFIILILMGEDARQRMFRTACFIGGLAVMAWQLPELWKQLAPALRWFANGRAAITTAMPSTGSVFGGSALDIAGAIVGGIVFLAAWTVLRKQRPDPAQLVLFALGAFTFVLALAVRGAMPLFVVALALSVGAAFDAATSDEAPVQNRAPIFGAIALIVVLAVAGFVPTLRRADPALREERIAFVAGLRWMRANTVSSGPWNSPQSSAAWGVLSTVADGPLVQYHARRPALVSPSAVLSGLAAVRDAGSALHSSDPARFVRFLQGQRASYVVVGPRQDRLAREIADVSRTPNPHSPSMYDLLACTAADSDGEVLPGIACAFASKRRVGYSGCAPIGAEPAGPAISIYSLKETSAETPRAEMRPR